MKAGTGRRCLAEEMLLVLWTLLHRTDKLSQGGLAALSLQQCALLHVHAGTMEGSSSVQLASFLTFSHSAVPAGLRVSAINVSHLENT